MFYLLKKYQGIMSIDDFIDLFCYDHHKFIFSSLIKNVSGVLTVEIADYLRYSKM